MKFITSLKVLFILLMSSAGFFVANGQGLLNLKSPDKNLVFQLSIKADGPGYQLSYKGAALIAPSALGFKLTDLPGIPVTKIKLHSKKKIKNKYPERGLHSEARDNSRVYLVDFLAKEALEYQLEVKVADNGVAFRYLKTDAGTANLSADATRFVLPLGSTFWSQSDIHSYEGRYTKEAADTIAPGKKVGPPLTVLLPESRGYLAITEGGLVDMPGMSLLLTAPRTFTAVLAGPAVLSGHLQTGWRIIEYGRNLNDLVNNDMISNVSRPIDPVLFPQGLNTAWIKPGKSVWSWLTRNRSVTLPNMKQLTDWASELKIPYNLVDEGWGKWSASDKTKWDFIKELVDYSAPKHVGIWVWKAYPDRNGVPGLKDSVERVAFFKSCHEAGVVGVKIDFFDAESQEVIRFYEAALRDAAKYHIMVDFHGADKPTGLSRTYPNEMSREGIRGLENETDWPAHNTTLPFTRFLAGHGDYTPLSFGDIVKGTTITHQVATVASFNSAFMCLAVDPDDLLKSNVRPMVMALPETWDETIVLGQSRIGDLAVFARRKGKEWFLSVLNGAKKSRQIKVKLDFLKRGKYSIDMLKDNLQDPLKAELVTKTVQRKDQLTIELAGGGGFVGRISAVK